MTPDAAIFSRRRGNYILPSVVRILSAIVHSTQPVLLKGTPNGRKRSTTVCIHTLSRKEEASYIYVYYKYQTGRKEKELLHPYWENNKRQKGGIIKKEKGTGQTQEGYVSPDGRRPCGKKKRGVHNATKSACYWKKKKWKDKKWNKNSFESLIQRTNTSTKHTGHTKGELPLLLLTGCWTGLWASIAGRDFGRQVRAYMGTHHICACMWRGN